MTIVNLQRVVLIEDDRRLAELVSRYLESSGGLNVEIVDLEGSVLSQVQALRPAVVILDLGLPKEDGLTICKQLRAVTDVPILILTARDNDIDHVLGFEFGADDYVVKPVNPRVLLARISALLRRGQRQLDSKQVLRFGSLSVDTTARSVVLEGRPIALSDAEFDVLADLAAHAGEIQSREELFRRLLGREYDGMDRILDVRISHLRRKLGDDAATSERIKTIWGQGYLFVPTAW